MTEDIFDKRVAALGLVLPAVPKPIANFLPFRREGSTIYLAGQVCELEGEVVYRGKVGRDFDLATGQAAARICALNLLAALRLACGGSFGPVKACIRLGGFVNCTPDFEQAPQVINGASDLFGEIFGEAGLHARTAIGVAALPRGAAVEVDAFVAVKS
ncbi:MAG: RidA family protein [Rhodopseudomonas sp.]|nr:RidA family protein [Rhodopseudomonas sp.]